MKPGVVTSTLRRFSVVVVSSGSASLALFCLPFLIHERIEPWTTSSRRRLPQLFLPNESRPGGAEKVFRSGHTRSSQAPGA
jgi:hypothetical protein